MSNCGVYSNVCSEAIVKDDFYPNFKRLSWPVLFSGHSDILTSLKYLLTISESTSPCTNRNTTTPFDPRELFLKLHEVKNGLVVV